MWMLWEHWITHVVQPSYGKLPFHVAFVGNGEGEDVVEGVFVKEVVDRTAWWMLHRSG